MCYYMRYIVTDEEGVSLLEIEQALQTVDPSYSIQDGDLRFGDDLYGQIEVNRSGDTLFEEEIEEFIAELEDIKGGSKKTVETALRSANTIVAVQVLWQGRETEETLGRVDPLWEWLFANRQGLLQADGEGYYSTSGLVLQVD
jgi:hypothetical protein